ncbi:MAG: hypothetical protein Q8896_00905, partial [Bacteroidota bacterium]|nr:hypothetical protein [Bacteroidota bacterium]
MNSRFKILLVYCTMLISTGSLYAQGWPDTCAHLREREAVSPGNEQEAKLQYDTLRLYIQVCAVSDNT